MSVDLQIVPFFHSIELFGFPDQTTAYSLSGHVTLSLSSASCAERLLLESIQITFEGQSELVSDTGECSSIRLCHITRELAKDMHIDLANENGIQPSSTHEADMRWEFIFDLPIPGWLPETSVFGKLISGRSAGIQYALYAKAQVRDLNRGSSSSSSLDLHTGLIHAQHQPITLNRVFTAPPPHTLNPDYNYLFPLITHSYEINVSCPNPPELNCIPSDVMTAIELAVDAPEHLSVKCGLLPLCLRSTISSCIDEDRKQRVKITAFKMDIRQVETYRSVACPSYASRFPLPPPAEQPPNLPFLSPPPFENTSSITPSPSNEDKEVDVSLLPDEEPVCHVVLEGGMSLLSDGWSKIEVQLNLDEELLDNDWFENMTESHSDRKRIRTSSQSPFLDISHHLYVELIFAYEHERSLGDESSETSVIKEAIDFILPLHFVEPATPLSASSSSSSSSSTSLVSANSNGVELSPRPRIKTPAYSQLFHSNGEPREEALDMYGEILPMYRKNTEDTEAASTPPL